MLIQFDGEIDDNDLQPLINQLNGQGHKVIQIHRSRWVGKDKEDRGGRIDIEIPDDHQLAVNFQKIIDLDNEIKVNPKVHKPNGNGGQSAMKAK